MRPALAVPALLSVVPFLAACAEPAVVSAVNARLPDAGLAAEAPALTPLGPLLAEVDGRAPAPPLAGLDGRIARLEARAAGLRPPVLSAADRRRLDQPVARP